MAIEYPIDWLNTGHLTGLIVEQQVAVASTTSPYSYKEQTQAYQGERFSFSADISLEDATEIRAFSAWIAALRGTLGTFSVHWSDLQLDTGEFAALPIADAGAFLRGNREFNIVNANLPIPPAIVGHPFTIYANAGQVQWHTGIVAAITGGTGETINVFPALRRDIPQGVGATPYSIGFTQAPATPNINRLTCRLTDTPTLPVRSPFRAQVRLNFTEVIV